VLFEKAENKDWILFFDEADALLSKGSIYGMPMINMPNRKLHICCSDSNSYRGL
jgi:hypothetical protein